MGVITWCWLAFIALGIACCSLCAHAENAPDWAVRIMAETHKRVIVEHQDWYARDFRYVPEGQEVWGNCSTFATTALVLAISAGQSAQIIQCGHAHVVTVVGGWMFDAREDGPVPVACEE